MLGTRRTKVSGGTRRVSFGAILALAIAIRSTPAQALGLDALGIDVNSLVGDGVVKALVGFVAFGTQHRPYEPATPLGLAAGVDFSVELTLTKIPDSLFASLASFGTPAASPVPALPLPRLHFHKGLGDFVDVGTSLLYFPRNWFVGLDAKIVLVQGEEGPTLAFRFCYSYTDVNFNGINLSTKTFSPQLLVSRQLEFADPYLGAGLEYATGAVKATITIPADITAQVPAGVSIPPLDYQSPTVSAYGGEFFGGISLRVPRSGLRLTIEGSYNTAGTSTLGTKIGFTF